MPHLRIAFLFALVSAFGGCANDGLSVTMPDSGTLCASSIAKCSTLAPGAIFVVANKPMKYILNQEGRAKYFPYEFPIPPDNDGVYHSWRETKECPITISQDCFDALPVATTYPAGVNLHPGSFVVKRPSSDQLYVALPGNALAKIPADIAVALYSPAYSDGQDDSPAVVPDVFWPNWINRGPDIVEAHVHPGMLFVIDQEQKVFYADQDGSAREVTDAGFVANHFQRRFVRRVPQSAVSGMSVGTPIDMREPNIDDPTQSN